jgi:hypothetical protein
VAEGGGARKRLKEIKTELTAIKQKLDALKIERTDLKAKLQAEKDAKGGANKPAS